MVVLTCGVVVCGVVVCGVCGGTDLWLCVVVCGDGVVMVCDDGV